MLFVRVDDYWEVVVFDFVDNYFDYVIFYMFVIGVIVFWVFEVKVDYRVFYINGFGMNRLCYWVGVVESIMWILF